MSELISGKEAFDAAFNGVSAQWRWANKDEDWRELKAETAFSISELKGGVCEFRLKPRIITINGIEVPAPFEPKHGEKFYTIVSDRKMGYDFYNYFDNVYCSILILNSGAWRTEEEIKQVVGALRSIFK